MAVLLEGEVLRILVFPCYSHDMGRGYFLSLGLRHCVPGDGHGDKDEESLEKKHLGLPEMMVLKCADWSWSRMRRGFAEGSQRVAEEVCPSPFCGPQSLG